MHAGYRVSRWREEALQAVCGNEVEEEDVWQGKEVVQEGVSEDVPVNAARGRKVVHCLQR